MKPLKYRAFINHLKWIVPVKIIDFKFETVEVDLSSGQGDTAEYNFNEVELMQCTESRDDQNIEIYEGDVILVTHMLVENIPTYKAVVEWDKNRFALRNLDSDKPEFNFSMNGMGLTPYRSLDPFGLSLKVIGNKYKNPELMIKD